MMHPLSLFFFDEVLHLACLDSHIALALEVNTIVLNVTRGRHAKAADLV